jgi:hypothetical protein
MRRLVYGRGPAAGALPYAWLHTAAHDRKPQSDTCPESCVGFALYR